MARGSRTRRGNLPLELGWLADWMGGVDRQLDDLSRPTAGQNIGSTDTLLRTLTYLANLKTDGVAGGTYSTGTVANDAVVHWYATTPLMRLSAFEIPYGRIALDVTAGEVSITPGGSFVIAYLGYSIVDGNAVTIPAYGLGQRPARVYTDQRQGLPMALSDIVEIDPEINPGPYQISAYVGFWVAAGNVDPCEAVFQSPALRIEVLGEGVPAVDG